MSFSSVHSLSHVHSLRPHGHQASLSITNSQSLPKLMSIESVTPSNHLILCHPLLLPPSVFPSIRVFSMSQLFASGGQSIGVIVVVVQLLSHVQLFCDPIDKVDCKAALSVGFPSKNTGVGCHFLLDPWIRDLPGFPALAGGFSTTEPPGKPLLFLYMQVKVWVYSCTTAPYHKWKLGSSSCRHCSRLGSADKQGLMF